MTTTDEKSTSKPEKKQALRPQRVFQSVADVEEEMANAQGQIEAFYRQAESQGRGLTAGETESVNEHMEYYRWLEKEEQPRMQTFEQMKRDAVKREMALKTAAHRGGRFSISEGARGSSYEVAGLPKVIRRDLMAFRPHLFSGGEEGAVQAARDAGHWLRAVCFNNAESVQYCRDRETLRLDAYDERFDAQTVDDNTRGGVLVPTIIARTILDVRDRYGLIPQLARRYPMVGETDLVPKRADGLTVQKPGEDAAITTSEKTYGTSVSLACVDAYTLTYLSHKLMRGSVVDAADQVVNEIAWSFAKQMDYEGINGDGTSGTPDWDILGAVNGIAAGGKVTMGAGDTDWDSISAAYIRQLMGLLPDRFYTQSPGAGDSGAMGGPVFVCSRAFYADVFERLMDAGGGNNKFDISATSPFQYKGFPIRTTEHMPTSTAVSQMALLFGNFQDSMIIGQREDVGIATSSDFRFNFDQLSVRGRMSYDLKFHEKGDGSNAGGIVGLVTAAA